MQETLLEGGHGLVTAGYSVLVDQLAKGLDIRLRHRVARIQCGCQAGRDRDEQEGLSPTPTSAIMRVESSSSSRSDGHSNGEVSEGRHICSECGRSSVYQGTSHRQEELSSTDLVFPETSEGPWCSCSASQSTVAETPLASGATAERQQDVTAAVPEISESAGRTRRPVAVTTSEGRTVQADAVIVTIPIGVLR